MITSNPACYMKPEVLKVVSVEVTVWYVTPCSFVDRYQCFGGICCLHLQMGEFLRSIGTYLPNYTASRSRRPWYKTIWLTKHCACECNIVGSLRPFEIGWCRRVKTNRRCALHTPVSTLPTSPSTNQCPEDYLLCPCYSGYCSGLL
jgi:hypothetical protein